MTRRRLDGRQSVAIGLLVLALGIGGWYVFLGRPGVGGCTPGPEQRARGIVLSVQGTSPTDVASFVLRTDAGEQLTIFIGQLDLVAGFNAAHLREHQATAAPVVADYHLECDHRVASLLTDG